jgi:hypothetical protein
VEVEVKDGFSTRLPFGLIFFHSLWHVVMYSFKRALTVALGVSRDCDPCLGTRVGLSAKHDHDLLKGIMKVQPEKQNMSS